MPKLIKDGVLVQDNWLPPRDSEGPIGKDCVATLAQWQATESKSETAVQLEPGDDISPLLPHLQDVPLICINFPAFTDGRGFSYARELRDRGYKGELRAVGHFIRDQMTYLQRVGFNAFQPSGEADLEEALNSLDDFSEHYQASSDDPLPLFQRRG